MIKTLVDLNENLASSIALRYASHLSKLVELQMQIIHVEEVDHEQRAGGSGWVRKTWERGVKDAGAAAISRLLKTEKVDCTFAVAPRIGIGDHDSEILEELIVSGHELFIEGIISTSKIGDFYKLITNKLFSKAPCPMLIVKNLIINNKVTLICGDGVDHQSMITQFSKIFRGAKLDLELIYYKFQESKELLFLDKSEAGSVLTEAETILAAAGLMVGNSTVVCGSPEQGGDYLGNCGLVVSTFPTRKGPRMELLANSPAPLLLCR
ncbi:MAG: universal stress protein [Proteobacteria bacterium]|nr:universal stress protein [Pseudomonadota bacterium]MBU1714823.1 universal stress protein [Pseudomonadota bacterium]